MGVCTNFFEYGHSIQDKLISDTNLDFAILSNWQEHPKLNYALLCHEEILLVLPVGHPLAQKAVIKKERRYPWLDLSLFRTVQEIIKPAYSKNSYLSTYAQSFISLSKNICAPLF